MLLCKSRKFWFCVFSPPTLGGCAALWKHSDKDITPDFRDTFGCHLYWFVQHSPAGIALLAHSRLSAVLPSN